MQAFETYGHIDKTGRLKIMPELPLKEGDVKVIIMYNEEKGESDEALWLKSVSKNPAFEFLKDKEEDIYSLTDGKPFHD